MDCALFVPSVDDPLHSLFKEFLDDSQSHTVNAGGPPEDIYPSPISSNDLTELWNDLIRQLGGTPEEEPTPFHDINAVDILQIPAPSLPAAPAITFEQTATPETPHPAPIPYTQPPITSQSSLPVNSFGTYLNHPPTPYFNPIFSGAGANPAAPQATGINDINHYATGPSVREYPTANPAHQQNPTARNTGRKQNPTSRSSGNPQAPRSRRAKQEKPSYNPYPTSSPQKRGSSPEAGPTITHSTIASPGAPKGTSPMKAIRDTKPARKQYATKARKTSNISDPVPVPEQCQEPAYAAPKYFMSSPPEPPQMAPTQQRLVPLLQKAALPDSPKGKLARRLQELNETLGTLATSGQSELRPSGERIITLQSLEERGFQVSIINPDCIVLNRHEGEHIVIDRATAPLAKEPQLHIERLFQLGVQRSNLPFGAHFFGCHPARIFNCGSMSYAFDGSRLQVYLPINGPITMMRVQ